MPDTDILVSELNSASQINTTDLLLMTQPDGDAQTGYSSRKGTVLQVANKLLKDTEYTTDLPNFDNKSVFGALNEIHNGTYIYKENETPYAIRQTPITANRTLEKLIGVSCAFNQLVDFSQASGITDFNVIDSYTISCKNNLSDNAYPVLNNISGAVGHKYFISCDNGTSEELMIYHDNTYVHYNRIASKTKSEFFIYTDNYSLSQPILVVKSGSLQGETVKLNIIDLTACFGSSEVADYLYTLENS